MKRFLFVLAFLSSLQAHACDCIMRANAREYLEIVDYVFIGKVIERIKVPLEKDMPELYKTLPNGKEQWKAVEEQFEQNYARVIMIENIKGATVTTDTLYFKSEFSTCEPKYELNQTYLFFANQMKDGKYMMVPCTPFGEMKDSKKTIRQLRRKK